MMKNLFLKSLIFTALLICFSCAGIFAQNLQQNPKNPNKNIRQQRLLQTLGLSQDQVRQIQQINGEKRLQMDEAQMRFREATRNLDQAIYSDNAKEDEIQNHLKEVQAAQGEIVRIRFLTEFEVRKVLTPEQLNKFRQIRQQFMEKMRIEDNSEGEMKTPPPFGRRRFPKPPKN